MFGVAKNNNLVMQKRFSKRAEGFFLRDVSIGGSVRVSVLENDVDLLATRSELSKGMNYGFSNVLYSIIDLFH